MSVEIGELSEGVSCHGSVVDEGNQGGGGGRVGRGVDEVGDFEAGEEPVVSAVFEDVGSGHGSAAEAVDEEGLQLSFEEVEGNHDHGEGLQLRWLRRGIFVDVGTGEVAEGVDEEGPQVFDDEDSSPGNLEAQVFDEDGAAISKLEGLDALGLVVGNEGAVVFPRDAQAVHGEVGLGGDAVVEVGGAALHVDGSAGG